ncbi:MAG: thiol-disulfide oxidoreductase DCC family protein [Rhodoglobus sp.]
MAAQRSTASPANRVLIFDGDCAFCTLWVDRLRAYLPEFPASTPWQWIDLDDYALTRDDVENAAWLVTPSRQFAGHLAFSAILRSQPSIGWRFLGHLIATEPFNSVCALGYRFISRYRHRLPGGTPACAVRSTE